MAYTKQTWENLPSTNTPITADRLNHMENGIYDAYAINNTYSTSQTTGYSSYYINNNLETKGTILWTNSNPTSEFESQNITLSSSDYDMYEIFYNISYTSSDTTYMTTGKIPKGKSTQLQFAYSTSGDGYNLAMRQRDVTYVSDTQYTISKNNGVDGNYACRPMYVIGYKTGLFS